MPTYSLLRSGELVLDVAQELRSLARRWIPLNAEQAGRSGRHTISCRPERSEGPAFPDVLLNLTTVAASQPHEERIQLRGLSGASGSIDLSGTRAELGVDPNAVHADADLYSMLTLSAAFILGRLGHALMHAGAVVDLEGRAWLLVGDSHSGKTSTVVALVEAGWSYLADDQVVVSRSESGEVVIEGWPRIAHLDRGWSTRVSTGQRDPLDLRERHGARLLRSAPLGGVLLPGVRAEEATSSRAAHPAATFSALVRQSPWLMADTAVAPRVAQLLMSVASTNPRELVLGRDSYARGDVILERLFREASAPRDR